MTAVAEALVGSGADLGGVRVLRFNFPYMAARELDGRKRPPDRQPKLLAAYQEAIAAALKQGAVAERLIIGGKSMGGRIASMLAQEMGVAGLVCLGYPFHPPGRPAKLRTEHLKTLTVPTLICQGERDAFGGRDEVAEFALSNAIELCWLPDGDHSFRPRKKSGHTAEENLQRAIRGVVSFMGQLNTRLAST
jgi:predicted alpha/beta-hydrolase family hydrolase